MVAGLSVAASCAARVLHAQFLPHRQWRFGVVEGVEVQAGRAIVQQVLAQLGDHVHAEGADRGLVVAELGLSLIHIYSEFQITSSSNW